MKYRLIIKIILSVLILCLVTGCQSEASRKAELGKKDLSISERRIMADKISNEAESVSNVNRAVVVITEDLTAMVGLTVNEKNSKSADIEKKVKDKIANNNKNINNILITADPTLVKRLESIGAGIVEGKPIDKYDKEINKLKKDIK